MFPFLSDELIDLEHIVQQGNVIDVQSSIKEFENVREISNQSQISIILLKVYFSILDGNTTYYQQFIDEVLILAQETGNPIILFDAIILKAEVWRQLGNFIGAEALRHPCIYSEILPENLPEYIELVDRSEKYLNLITDKTSPDYILREAWLLRCKGIILRAETKLEISHRYLKKSLRLFEKSRNIVGIADVLQSIALAYGISGNWGKEIKYLRRSLSYYKKLNFQRAISNILIRIGNILFHYRSKFDAGFRYLTESLTILETIGCKHGIAVTLGYLGNMFTWQGDLIRAFKYLQRSLLISERIGNTENLAFVLNNLGWNYHIRGELYLALESLNRSMEISREKQYPWILIWTLSNIGLVHQAQTKFDSACGYYTQSIMICEEIDDYLAMAWSLYQVIKLTIDTDSLNHMKAHIGRLEGLSNKYQVKLMNQMSRVAKGMLLKRSLRLKDKVQAQEIFEQIVTEEMEALEVTADALINLCELYLFEFNASGDETVLKDVQQISDRLLDIAEEQNSNLLLSETYLLKAELALLEEDMPLTQQLLSKAQTIADQKGLEKLALAISRAHDMLLDQIEGVNSSTFQIRDGHNIGQIEDLLGRMKTKNIAAVSEAAPEEPIMLLIVAEGGMTLFNRVFPPEKLIKGHLVGSFLSAIESFSKEVFSSSIERVTLGEHRLIMMQIRDNFSCSYVFKGESYSAIKKLKRFIRSLESNVPLWNKLKNKLKTGSILKNNELSEINALVDRIFL